MNTGASVWGDHETGDYSLREIAKALGHGLTRNAVCGKLHRLNVPVSTKAAAHGYTRPPREKIMAAPEPEVPEPDATPVKNGELQFHHCKWPLGDPAQPDFRFCGGLRQETRPYCRKHLAVAFNRQPAPRVRPW